MDININFEYCIRTYDLIFIIKSKPDYFNKRSSIRRTWGSTVKCVFFLVGNSAQNTLNNQVYHESSVYSDIVFCPIIDHYSNLTFKVTPTSPCHVNVLSLGFVYVNSYFRVKQPGEPINFVRRRRYRNQHFLPQRCKLGQ